MAQFPQPTEEKVYENDLAQVFQKLMLIKIPDVQFIFEGKGDEEAVKVPAHKDVLAAMSPVFDTMFNGELKEKGDVKIVDASAAAFKEFLQFFYQKQVKLTMENIDEVLNLANKYNVTSCSDMGVAFLKEHLTSEKDTCVNLLKSIAGAQKTLTKLLNLIRCAQNMISYLVKGIDCVRYGFTYLQNLKLCIRNALIRQRKSLSNAQNI